MNSPNEINLKDLIKSLLSEIGKHDPFMRNHAERVAAICLRFSKGLGLDQKEANTLYLAGLLHDVGYIYLPSNILQKRGQRNSPEDDIMKRHPLISEKIISKYPMLEELLPIIRHHHESIDGTGYPDGLKESEIPLGAKILCLANWFDSMTTSRPQFKSMKTEDVLAQIEEMAGQRFNRGLAENFIYFIKSSEFVASQDEGRIEQIENKDNKEPEVKTQEAVPAPKEFIQNIIGKYKKDELELPILSRVVQEVQDAMHNPTTTVDELSAIIERDAVISVRLIAVANSPIYRGTDKVFTVRNAIPRVGVKETHSIVTTISNKSIYDTNNKQFKAIMEKMWLHSLSSGYIARSLSKRLKFGEPDKYYFLGLIHDIGKVLLLKAFCDRYGKNSSMDIGMIMAEIRYAHSSFGGVILRKWGYPEGYVRIPLLHEGPDFRRDTDKEILTINLASAIANSNGYGYKDDISYDPKNLTSTRLLDVDTGMIEDLGEEVKALMEEASNVF
jgi:HD-GYP domain-containing protein (c-di-GMP phosphodiesterase class II)